MSRVLKYINSVFKDKDSRKSKSISSKSSRNSSENVIQKKPIRGSAQINVGEKIQVQTLSSLVREIENSVSVIKKHLKEKNLEEPSFVEGNTAVLPHAMEIREARKSLNEALLSLRALNQYDSFEFVKEVAYGYTQTTAFMVAAKYRIALILDPSGEAMHISDICMASGCRDERKLIAALRVLTQSYVFKEVQEGHFAHTRFSLEMRDSMKIDLLTFDHILKCTIPYYEAMEKWPGSTDPKHSPFNIGAKTDKSFFEFLMADPVEMSRFMNAIQGISLSAVKMLQTVYPWEQLGDATIVDMGTARGHVALSISQAAPNLKWTLQDLPDVISEAETLFDPEYKSRFEFEAHDFFMPQPRKADVYFLRMILHDHSDDVCKNIIKNIVHQLKPGKYGSGGRILVCDTVFRPAVDRPPTDLSVTQINMSLLMLLNAADRTFLAVRALFLAVDPRFKLKKWGDGGPQASEIVEAWLEE